MLKKLKLFLLGWFKRHIADDCPPHLENEEFSNKYRN